MPDCSVLYPTASGGYLGGVVNDYPGKRIEELELSVNFGGGNEKLNEVDNPVCLASTGGA